jgi:hypothetical protein
VKELQTRTQQVRAAITECIGQYRSASIDIVKATERSEELWFEIDDLLTAMESAEAQEDDGMVRSHLHTIYLKLGSVQQQLPPAYG